jgi:hypothetical protein
MKLTNVFDIERKEHVAIFALGFDGKVISHQFDTRLDDHNTVAAGLRWLADKVQEVGRKEPGNDFLEVIGDVMHHEEVNTNNLFVFPNHQCMRTSLLRCWSYLLSECGGSKSIDLLLVEHLNEIKLCSNAFRFAVASNSDDVGKFRGIPMNRIAIHTACREDVHQHLQALIRCKRFHMHCE